MDLQCVHIVSKSNEWVHHNGVRMISLRSSAFQSVEKGETSGDFSSLLASLAELPLVSPFLTDWNAELRRLAYDANPVV